MIAGLILGAVIGALGAIFLFRRRRTRRVSNPDLYRKSSNGSLGIPVLSHPQEVPHSDATLATENGGYVLHFSHQFNFNDEDAIGPCLGTLRIALRRHRLA